MKKIGIGKMILNKKIILISTLIAFFSLNIHAAQNEWAFLLNLNDIHLVNSDRHLKPYTWFTKKYRFDNFCNASFFTNRDAVGPYITDSRIKPSNVYNWWWIGWSCDTVFITNRALTQRDKRHLRGLVAGTPVLVRNHKLVGEKEMLESCTRGFFYRKCPRTSIGIIKNKIFIFITSSSNIPDLQKTMQRYGCSYALNLDGGGSTFIRTTVSKFPKKIKRSYPNLLAW